MIKFLIDPFNLLIFLILFTVTARMLKLEISFKWLLATSIGWFFIISTPLFTNLLLVSLEEQYTPIKVEEFSEKERQLAHNIVVLGGGHSYDDRLPANSLLSLKALARLNEGIRLHKALPNSQLVLSGYSASNRVPQADMLKRTALLLGVSSKRIITQPEPGNTTEEAKVYSKNFGGDTPVILVTSAAHMPRAIGAFSFYGIETIASPAHYRILENERSHWIGWPSVRNILNMKTSMYEYAAIARDRGLGFRDE